MAAKELFHEILKDKDLMKKYNYDLHQLEEFELHRETNIDMVNVLTIIVNGIENQIPQTSIYTQIKNYFKIS